jgi:hypothetical protein
MGDGLKKAKEYFDKAKPRSKGSAGRESAEKSRTKAVDKIASRREKVKEIDEAGKKNPGFKFSDQQERDRVDRLQPGPEDYPEYFYDQRKKRMMVPNDWSPKKNAEGGYFRGRTASPDFNIDYPGLMLRYKGK